MEGTYAITTINDYEVVLWLHTAEEFPDAAWNQHFEGIAAHMRDNKVPKERMRHLVVTDGAAPNARQRVQMKDMLFHGGSVPLSVITTALSNPVKRGIATAISWLNPAAKFYSPAEAEQALAHLDLAGAFPKLWPTFVEMEKRIGRPIESLRQAAKAARPGDSFLQPGGIQPVDERR